jgi:catechol 2,3-dioxygenase-like lactoylglutathione lyase family enzyme
MLTHTKLVTQIPVVNTDRAIKFYHDLLGLEIVAQPMPGLWLLTTTQGSEVMLYERPPTKADHTVMAFIVDDIDQTVDELIAKGVVFEQYDNDFIKTDTKGIAASGPAKVAWFKDTEGNILALNNKM